MCMSASETTDLSPASDQAFVAAESARLNDLPAEDLVRWAGDCFGDKLVLTASFGGASGMVLLDMVHRLAPSVPVVLIDTGVLFPQTYQSVLDAEKHYGIKVERISPARSMPAQAVEFGDELWKRAPDQCCNMRKVEPLAAALHGKRAWMTAVRRDQSDTRAQTQAVTWNARHGLVKLAPLVRWSEEEIWAYVHMNGVPFNPMLADGYASIGCTHCTSRPINDDPRSGRWINFAKKECGLHI